MLQPQQITETILLISREGINLQDVASCANIDEDTAAKSFFRLTTKLKEQPGCIRQFWGCQVEDPKVFVWCISESYSTVDDLSMMVGVNFINSDLYGTFLEDLAELFDLEATFITMYTLFKSDPDAAFEAPVTEVSIYTLPTDTYNEETKTMIDEATKSSMELVITVGKSSGGAAGWVSKTRGYMAGNGESVALHGVFGYASVEDHLIWRATPEHAQIIQGFAPIAHVNLRSADVPGGGLFVPGESMFHVNFQKGV